MPEIPDAAVTKALRELEATYRPDRMPTPDDVRAALEAALPHLLASWLLSIDEIRDGWSPDAENARCRARIRELEDAIRQHRDVHRRADDELGYLYGRATRDLWALVPEREVAS